ncbi:MAG: hypothetical protein BWY07_02682 [Candidatus Hydrogenedentes bacterium ADurb.Bin170]|nr:MAG: hypothetical protein BWY07_02682 [Candidatus Hydrogenedentes bacterium ADurb.Bin170]
MPKSLHTARLVSGNISALPVILAPSRHSCEGRNDVERQG